MATEKKKGMFSCLNDGLNAAKETANRLKERGVEFAGTDYKVKFEGAPASYEEWLTEFFHSQTEYEKMVKELLSDEYVNECGLRETL